MYPLPKITPLKLSPKPQKGFAPIALVVFLLFGIAAGTILIQNGVNFSPKASETFFDCLPSEVGSNNGSACPTVQTKTFAYCLNKEDPSNTLISNKIACDSAKNIAPDKFRYVCSWNPTNCPYTSHCNPACTAYQNCQWSSKSNEQSVCTGCSTRTAEQCSASGFDCANFGTHETCVLKTPTPPPLECAPESKSIEYGNCQTNNGMKCWNDYKRSSQTKCLWSAKINDGSSPFQAYQNKSYHCAPDPSCDNTSVNPAPPAAGQPASGKPGIKSETCNATQLAKANCSSKDLCVVDYADRASCKYPNNPPDGTACNEAHTKFCSSCRLINGLPKCSTSVCDNGEVSACNTSTSECTSATAAVDNKPYTFCGPKTGTAAAPRPAAGAPAAAAPATNNTSK